MFDDIILEKKYNCPLEKILKRLSMNIWMNYWSIQATSDHPSWWNMCFPSLINNRISISKLSNLNIKVKINLLKYLKLFYYF